MILQRDNSSGAVLNTNKASLAEYKEKKRLHTRLAAMEREIEEMRDQIAKLNEALLNGTTKL